MSRSRRVFFLAPVGTLHFGNRVLSSALYLVAPTEVGATAGAGVPEPAGERELPWPQTCRDFAAGFVPNHTARATIESHRQSSSGRPAALEASDGQLRTAAERRARDRTDGRAQSLGSITWRLNSRAAQQQIHWARPVRARVTRGRGLGDKARLACPPGGHRASY